MQQNNVFSALLVAIGLSLAGFFVGHALKTFKQPQRYVTVKGLAERIVTADQAIWQVRFTNANDDISALYADIDTSRNAVMHFFKQENIAASDASMQPVQVTDNQSSTYNSNQKSKRFVANSSITVDSHQVDKVKEALQHTGDLVKAGVILNQSNVRYVFTKLNDIKPGMLREATANAKTAADIFARDSQTLIGRIRHASQGLFSIRDADGSYGNDNPSKKVRIVTTVQYDLQ